MKARLVRVAAKEAALLTPRRCMALAEVDRGGGAPLSLCVSCRRALAGPTPEERAATQKAFDARQTLLFDKAVVERRVGK